MINNILKKIEKANEVESSKVELAKHEVDLGLADDIKKQANVLNTLIKNHGFAIQKKVVEDYNKQLKDLGLTDTPTIVRNMVDAIAQAEKTASNFEQRFLK